MGDPSKAQIRTTMAWQRTAFALGSLAAVAIKLTMVNHEAIGSITAISALVGSAILYVFGRVRFESDYGPFVMLVLCASVVVLIGATTFIQIM